VNARSVVQAACIALLPLAAAAGDATWQATGGLVPDTGRGMQVSALAVDTGLGQVYAGTDTGTVYRRAAAPSDLPPVANDDLATTPSHTPVAIAVLANDYDPGGALVPGSVTLVEPPAYGIAAAQPDGVVIYAPDDGFVGVDGFAYTMQNGAGQTSAPAWVTVEVTLQVLGFVPPAVDFGSRPLGSPSQPVEVRVRNDGQAEIRLGTLSLDGDAGAFELVQQACTDTHLEPGLECAFLVRFTAATPGAHAAALAFAASSGEATLAGIAVEVEDRVFANGFE
jgi:hypothetical protein